MKGYKFYSLNDPQKEAISSWCAVDKQDAIKKFAKVKSLSIEDFRRIYGVEKLDPKSYDF